MFLLNGMEWNSIIETNGIVRHVQLKASYIGSKTSRQKIHVKLADKPSGCVVWIYFDENTLELGPFYFFGGSPGNPLPPIQEERVARHTKGDQDGYKAEHPNIRELNKGQFTKYESILDIYTVLFGISNA